MKSTATENKFDSAEYPTLYQNNMGDIILIVKKPIDDLGAGVVVGHIPETKGTWPVGQLNDMWIMSYLTKYLGTITISTE